MCEATENSWVAWGESRPKIVRKLLEQAELKMRGQVVFEYSK